ncbi:MAG: hypothetical protein NT086_07115 [Proteobacteria bacterium]|nr:hypothetical protein [Pseudomonadota bacterium]
MKIKNTQIALKIKNKLIVAKKGLFIVFGNGLNALSNFFVASILVSNYGLKEFGLFATLQATYFVFEAISRPLTWQAMVKFYTEKQDRLLIGLSIRLEIISFFIVFVISMISYNIAINFFEFSNYFFPCLAMLIGSFFINNGTVIGYYRAKTMYSHIAILQCVCACLRCLIVYFYHTDVLNLFAVMIFAEATIWSLAIILLLRIKSMSMDKNKVEIKEYTRYSFWGTLHTILDLPVTQFDRLLIANLAGLQIVGVYAILKRLVLLIGQLSEAVSQICFQKFVKLVEVKDFNGIKNICWKLSLFVAIGCFFILIVFFSLFEYIDFKFFGSKLIEYKNTAAIYMAVYILGAIFVWLHPLTLALGLMRKNAKILLIVNITYIFLILLLVPNFMLSGVVAAYFIQVLLIVTIKYSIIKKASLNDS